MELERVVRAILDNKDLELELESPDKKYYFVYSTNIVAKEIEVVNSTQLMRTYWLASAEASTSGPPAWGAYQHEMQVESVTNLIRFAKYNAIGVYDKWQLKCPRCDSVYSGKIWRNSPKSCETKFENKKCGYEFQGSDKVRHSAKTLFAELVKTSTSQWESQKLTPKQVNPVDSDRQKGLF